LPPNNIPADMNTTNSTITIKTINNVVIQTPLI
jgi:hypothetical protein